MPSGCLLYFTSSNQNQLAKQIQIYTANTKFHQNLFTYFRNETWTDGQTGLEAVYTLFVPFMCLVQTANSILRTSQVKFFWIVTQYSVAVRYQRFRGPCCCLHLQHRSPKRWYPTATLHCVKSRTRFDSSPS
jgi:hypothetical protein